MIDDFDLKFYGVKSSIFKLTREPKMFCFLFLFMPFLHPELQTRSSERNSYLCPNWAKTSPPLRIPSQFITSWRVFTCTARCHHLQSTGTSSCLSGPQRGPPLHALGDSLLPVLSFTPSPLRVHHNSQSRRGNEGLSGGCRSLLPPRLPRGEEGAPRWPIYRPELDADVTRQSGTVSAAALVGFIAEQLTTAESPLTSAKTGSV